MSLSSALPRFGFFQWALLLFIFAWGCAAPAPAGREWAGAVYREKTDGWQMKIRMEGWSESRVHSILLQFRGLAAYRMEIADHWDTPKGFMQKGFSGDCGHVGVSTMGTPKRPGYPHRVRVLIVEGLFGDHALLRTEMPEGGWKAYDVVHPGVPVPAPSLFRPVVGFDERAVDWFPSRAEPSRSFRQADALMAGGPGAGR